jgi:hypothetical protein
MFKKFVNLIFIPPFMSKVLTYHESKWEPLFKSVVYGKNEIDNDPQGGDTESAPTSIPSPFARFDLVRTALRIFTKWKS